MKSRLYLLGGLVLATLAFGCNIFSPFYSEGSSDDPQALLEDGQAALRDGRPKEALKILSKAMERDSTNPHIRYFHAVATVRAADKGISFQSFIDMLEESVSTPTSMTKEVPAISGTHYEIQLFRFGADTLTEILRVFRDVNIDLQPVVDGLRRGTIRLEDFPYADDAYLSQGVAALVYGFVLMLDDHHQPQFQLNPWISINRIGDIYEVVSTNPDVAEDQIKQIIRDQYCILQEGLESLWYYYRINKFGELPPATVVPPVPPAHLTNEGQYDSTPAGTFFKVVYSGLDALHEYSQPNPCN